MAAARRAARHRHLGADLGGQAGGQGERSFKEHAVCGWEAGAASHEVSAPSASIAARHDTYHPTKLATASASLLVHKHNSTPAWRARRSWGAWRGTLGTQGGARCRASPRLRRSCCARGAMCPCPPTGCTEVRRHCEVRQQVRAAAVCAHTPKHELLPVNTRATHCQHKGTRPPNCPAPTYFRMPPANPQQRCPCRSSEQPSTPLAAQHNTTT